MMTPVTNENKIRRIIRYWMNFTAYPIEGFPVSDMMDNHSLRVLIEIMETFLAFIPIPFFYKKFNFVESRRLIYHDISIFRVFVLNRTVTLARAISSLLRYLFQSEESSLPTIRTNYFFPPNLFLWMNIWFSNLIFPIANFRAKFIATVSLFKTTIAVVAFYFRQICLQFSQSCCRALLSAIFSFSKIISPFTWMTTITSMAIQTNSSLMNWCRGYFSHSSNCMNFRLSLPTMQEGAYAI